MKLQLNPNAWSCLPTSFAMVLDVPVREVIDHLGHDGSATINTLREPLCRRCFHIQELIDVAWFVYKVPFITVMPEMIYEYPDGSQFCLQKRNLNRWLHYPGVFVIPNHALAWDGNTIFDSKGKVYSIDKVFENIDGFYVKSDVSKNKTICDEARKIP